MSNNYNFSFGQKIHGQKVYGHSLYKVQKFNLNQFLFNLLNLKELEKTIENLFRTRFHSLNKELSLIDPDHTEKVDKKIFKILLER